MQCSVALAIMTLWPYNVLTATILPRFYGIYLSSKITFLLNSDFLFFIYLRNKWALCEVLTVFSLLVHFDEISLVWFSSDLAIEHGNHVSYFPGLEHSILFLGGAPFSRPSTRPSIIRCENFSNSFCTLSISSLSNSAILTFGYVIAVSTSSPRIRASDDVWHLDTRRIF